MKINIKKQDTNQLTKELMIVALVINALALVLHLILNMFTGVALNTGSIIFRVDGNFPPTLF